MKKVKFNGKLSLKKETVANLDKSVGTTRDYVLPTLAYPGSCPATCGTVVCT